LRLGTFAGWHSRVAPPQRPKRAAYLKATQATGGLRKAALQKAATRRSAQRYQVREAPRHHPPANQERANQERANQERANQERAKVNTSTGVQAVAVGPLESRERVVQADGDPTVDGDQAVAAVAVGLLESRERVAQVDGDPTVDGDQVVAAVAVGLLESRERVAQADGDPTVDGDQAVAAGLLESRERVAQVDGDQAVAAGPLESRERAVAAAAAITAGRAVAVAVAVASLVRAALDIVVHFTGAIPAQESLVRVAMDTVATASPQRTRNRSAENGSTSTCTIGPQRRASQERAVLVEEIGVEMASGPLALESRARVDQDLMMIGIADPVMVTGIALALANPERVDLMAESDGVLNINVSTLIEHRV